MAGFKTAYLQRTVPVDVIVVGPESPTRKQAILRNDLVKLTPATSTVNAYIQKATSLSEATHVVGLTDMTMSNGHVRTDLKNYKPSELIAANSTTVPTDKTGTTKKVGLYPIYDKNDIILDEDSNDLASAT